MTQYKRITGKVFGGNATATGDDPQIAQFGSALANTFVGTTDPATIQQLPAWGQGWIGAVTPETQFPPLPEMTGAMKVLSHQICGILQQGVSTWDNGTTYYTGNFASKNGIIYVSLSDLNQGNDPEVDTTNWRSYGGADIDLSNLSGIGKNIGNWSTNLTNCWTKIPQRIKLELANGTLTLKAGSVAIFPYGTEAPTMEIGDTLNGGLIVDISWDETNSKLFYFVKYNEDLTHIQTSLNNADTLGVYVTNEGKLTSAWLNTNLVYDTENNIVNRDGGTGESLPVAVCTQSNGVTISIKHTFNGMGYIGSTFWVDKGCEGLIPNGRNEDGSLRNIKNTNNKINLRTIASNTTGDMVCVQSSYGNISYAPPQYYSYNAEKNQTFWYNTLSPVVRFADLVVANGVITNFQPKQVFHALDYNDKATIQDWAISSAMPSREYVNLTLGASGTTYTMPADGWLLVDLQMTSGKNFVVWNTTKQYGSSVSSSATFGQAILLPVNESDKVTVEYNSSGAVNHFRFIYARGAR